MNNLLADLNVIQQRLRQPMGNNVTLSFLKRDRDKSTKGRNLKGTEIMARKRIYSVLLKFDCLKKNNHQLPGACA